ncbi:hypothetical protein ACINLE_17320 [Bacillus sp. z60-18]|uniref:hypothetical protein n=1 Tax=unclassified Bacillus (in: firmicutes) TaxID=185979 RepID=UPI0024094F35|nr:hypothetical protein [Bacillus sp. HSf4]WFA06353.1 hypothetical protein P3X63_06075 [Bacillus sp. HSf4]
MIILKKIMGIVLFFGILSLSVFYIFSLMADPFDARNAEEITLVPAEKNGKTIRIEERREINEMLDVFNKGKRMKKTTAHELSAPDYRGDIKMNDTHRVRFTVWLKEDEAVILKNEDATYFHLNRKDKAVLIKRLQKGTQARVPFSAKIALSACPLKRVLKFSPSNFSEFLP